MTRIFRTGWDSLPAVESASRDERSTRCNSGTDSKVWMGEDEQFTMVYLAVHQRLEFGALFIRR